MTLRDLFNATYRLAWPKDTLALMDMIQGPNESLSDYYARQGVAVAALQQKGQLVDMAIMVFRWNAFDVMYNRTVMQLPWEGTAYSGSVPPPTPLPWGPAPAGTLPTVFIDERDPSSTMMRLSQLYPALAAPGPGPSPVIVPPAGMVGNQTIFGPYVANQSAVDAYKAGTLHDGDVVISALDGKPYVFHVLGGGIAFNFTPAPPPDASIVSVKVPEPEPTPDAPPV